MYLLTFVFYKQDNILYQKSSEFCLNGLWLSAGKQSVESRRRRTYWLNCNFAIVDNF